VGAPPAADGEEVAGTACGSSCRKSSTPEDKTKPLSDDALVEELGKAASRLPAAR